MKQIVFLDVDGTMIDYHGVLPESAKKAIIEARKNGHKIYTCTGCSKFEIDVKHWDFELDGMIGGNGCYIESDKKVIFHKPLTVEQCTHFVDWCHERGLGFRLECNSGMYASDDYLDKSFVANLKYRFGEDVEITEEMKQNRRKPTSITLGANLYRDDCNKTGFVLKSIDDYYDAIKEFPGLKVGTWGGKGEHPLYGDVGPIVDKASGIKMLLDYLGSDGSNTIGFGDAKSDLPMFNMCTVSVAMGNAGVEAKEAATFVTDEVMEDGLYNAFKKLGLI